MTPVLVYLLKAAAGLTVLYAGYWLLLKNETYFLLNRIYLVSSIVLSFLLPAFPIVSPFPASATAPSLDALAAAAPVGGAGFGWAQVLPLVYAVGALFFLVRLGAHLVRLFVLVRRNGIRRNGALRVVAVDRDFSPFSFLGLVFINARGLPPGDLRSILAHELVHVRQGHSIDVLLMELAVVLQWFNPFVWPYKKALRETHEYLADSGVIAQGFGAATYRRLVYEQHVGPALFEFGNNFKQSQIKRRILMLSRKPSSRAARLKLLLALPLTLALVLAFAHPPAAAQVSAADKKAAEQKAANHQKITIAEANSVDPEIKAKAVKIFDEIQKLEQMSKEISLKIEAEKDDATRQALAEKRVQIQKKTEELWGKLKEMGMLPPPPPPLPSVDQLNKTLAELSAKEADVQAKLKGTTDIQQRAELDDTLSKIALKRASIKQLLEKAKAGKAPYDGKEIK
jgi:ABC-type multidrug transport system fused ATPase/permease subunit